MSLEKIHSLKSLLRYCSFYDNVSIGDEIQQTIDLATAAGYALLTHPDKAILDSDCAVLLELQNHLYDIE
jgi:hypothetical protein